MSTRLVVTTSPIAGRYVVTESGCWEWTGARDRYGYATVHGGPRKRRAHRLSYQLSRGPIPAGLQIDHLCRVRHCVNPEHLEAVTPGENNRRKFDACDQVGDRLGGACRSGHPFDRDNTSFQGRRRVCRTCARARQQRWLDRQAT